MPVLKSVLIIAWNVGIEDISHFLVYAYIQANHNIYIIIRKHDFNRQYGS